MIFFFRKGEESFSDHISQILQKKKVSNVQPVMVIFQIVWFDAQLAHYKPIQPLSCTSRFSRVESAAEQDYRNCCSDIKLEILLFKVIVISLLRYIVSLSSL